MNSIVMISQNNWEPGELSSNNVIPVRSSFGLGIPQFNEGDSWRVTQGAATHLLLSGARMDLQAPGPFWLSGIPTELLGRSVTTVEFGDILVDKFDKELFWKAAEAKVDFFDAGVCNITKEEFWQRTIPTMSTLFQYSDPVTLGNEYRFFVNEGVVVTGSQYVSKHDDVTTLYYDDESMVKRTVEFVEAESFLKEALKVLEVPDGVVIDVSFIDKKPIILEANPAWCSAWYGCDIDRVAETIISSNSFSKTWGWDADDYLYEKYSKKQKLKFE